jgi:hypothetical protein
MATEVPLCNSLVVVHQSKYVKVGGLTQTLAVRALGEAEHGGGANRTDRPLHSRTPQPQPVVGFVGVISIR